jgi:hypothetical protein
MEAGRQVEAEQAALIIEGDADASLTITGYASRLHEDPEKVRELLDLLEMPEGTRVRVITRASSVIVR